LPKSFAGTFVPCSALVDQFKKLKNREGAMLVALQVNFALWIMIGCGVAEIAHVVGYLT